jgi:hypothetical protein
MSLWQGKKTNEAEKRIILSSKGGFYIRGAVIIIPEKRGALLQWVLVVEPQALESFQQIFDYFKELASAVYYKQLGAKEVRMGYVLLFRNVPFAKIVDIYGRRYSLVNSYMNEVDALQCYASVELELEVSGDQIFGSRTEIELVMTSNRGLTLKFPVRLQQVC